MTSPLLRRTILSAGIALACLTAGQITHADDTEVYIGQPSTAADGRPNILFIIDTSGSMDGKVTTQVPYNPNTKYDGKCPDNRIYWKSPSASLSTPPVDANCALRKTGDVTGWIEASKFVCKTAKDLIDRQGFQPVTRTAQWQPANKAANSKWTTLRRADTTNYVECADDSDTTKIDPAHGDGNKRFAANGANGPFTDDSSQRLDWNASTNTTGTYTYYSSNYLNWYFNASSITRTRLEIVQEVAEKTLDTISDVNVGVMRFSTDGQGGMVAHPIVELTADNKTSLVNTINAMSPNGNTPLSETLYESYLYWGGKKWDWGSKSSPFKSVIGSRQTADDTVYKAPITASCQKNFIVYLTDGEPVSDTSSENNILKLLQSKTPGAACTPNTGAGAANTNGKCLDDLAEYMYTTDLSSEPGLQNVTTYTVGFGADVQGVAWATDLLKETARRGGGSFYEASDTATLTSVFTSIVQEILAVNTTFTAPTVSVNAFNRTQNLNDLYITVFGTSSGYHWPGNVKKYEVETNGTIVGADGNPAVEPSTGFFKVGARSFWSNFNDGPDVAAGGAAHKIPDPATRKVYTDIAGGTLTAVANSVVDTNTAITDEMLGGLDPADSSLTTARLINWIRGANIDAADVADQSKGRYVMGDPLHARPVTVIYGGNVSNPDMVLYSTTNDGYLHAIDTSTGEELWSYIPGQMLRRMSDLYIDKPQPAKRYGLDGNLVALKQDLNGNGKVDGSDKVYLFFGMGRGGQSYYALDITSKTAPKLLWRRGAASEITADGTTIPVADQLPGLAQTWSTPVPTQVKIGSEVRNVLIFGGGYDPSQDNVNDNKDDTGNRIFMLDALTGELLWHAGPTNIAGLGYDSTAKFTHAKLDHSIPADIRVLDLDGNGLADRMYAADMGGRVWRFDIHNGNTANTLVTGGVFASLGRGDGAGSNPADARRFYYPPDVSLIRSGSQTFLNLAIGSGYRGHPLNTQIRDRFYSLRDYAPFTAKTQTQYDNFPIIVESNAKLINVTTDINPTMPADALGWRINLDSAKGEKVLAEARTFGGDILFTTYLPNAGSLVPGQNTCVARQGANRLWTVRAADGRPVLNRDGSAAPDGSTDKPDSPEDRWGGLAQSGIAPEPVILFPETSQPTCIVGVEQCGITLTNDPVKTFWNSRDTDKSN